MKIARGFTFSPSRLLGVDRIKRKISRTVGVPTTRGGRQRKWGKMGGMR